MSERSERAIEHSAFRPKAEDSRPRTAEGGRTVSQGELFQSEQTYGVGEVEARLTRALAGAFPAEIWVRGEVTNFRPANQNGHVYFSLCERNNRRGPVSTLQVALFRQDRLRVERALRDWPDFRLADGIEVRIKGRINYFGGRVSLVMSDVDPVHTLGRLAADRDRVLRALAADGLLEANGRLPVPLVPLHVGLATSAGSAACEDVLHELEGSGFGFRVSLADARVQGTGAEASILRALAALGGVRPDVVLLVRGGGSRTDLATFDSERIARAVAAFPVPVFTGVGHEIDTSVCDEVAHRAFKTPTAAAAGVADLVRLAVERAERAWAGVGRIGRAAPVVAAERLEERAARLAARTVAGLDGATSRLDQQAGGVASLTRSRLRGAAAQLDHAAVRLSPGRLDPRLRRLEADLAGASRRLSRSAVAALAARQRTLDVSAARVSAADPAVALARGFSLTRTADGRLLRRVADVAPGDTLVTTVADGTVTSTVDATGSRP